MASTTASIAAENKFRERKLYRRLVQFCEIEVLTRFVQKQLFLPRLKHVGNLFRLRSIPAK